MKNLSNLEKKINSELTTKIKSTKVKHDNIYISIENENLLEVIAFLKNDNETKFTLFRLNRYVQRDLFQILN